MEQTTINKIVFLKNLYFYIVSLVGLMMMVISLVGSINVALRTYVFPKADSYNSYYATAPCDPTYIPMPEEKLTKATPEQCAKSEAAQKQRDEESRQSQRQRDIVTYISMFVVGLPLFILHWRIARRKVE